MRERYHRDHRAGYRADGRAYDEPCERRGPHGGRRAYDGAGPERRHGPHGPERRHGGHGPERSRSEWRGHWERLRERDREHGWSARGREMLRRYKQPIIGLTIVGAAAPLARSVRAADQPEVAERPALASALPQPGSLEDRIGDRWARSEADAARESVIRQAMATYRIPRNLAEDIHDYAVKNGLDPELGYGLVKTESAFKHRAVSNVGARGLTQVMPRTARWLKPGTTIEDLYNRHVNLDMGFGYLRDLIGKYDGNVRLALLAYNRGPGTVDRVLRNGGDPNNGYADKVLEGYDDLQA